MAYIVAGLFEIAGVSWVVADVVLDRRRAREIVSQRSGAYVPSPPTPRAMLMQDIEDRSLERDPNSGRSRMILRQRRDREQRELQRIALGSASAEREFRETVADMLRGNLVRRLRGPACLLIGIVLGTVANIANTH